jgi:hypothetical protein
MVAPTIAFSPIPNEEFPATMEINFGSIIAGTTSKEVIRYLSHSKPDGEIFDVALYLAGTDRDTVIGWGTAGTGGLFVKEGADGIWRVLTGTDMASGAVITRGQELANGSMPSAIGVHQDSNADGVFEGELPLYFKITVPSDAVAKQYVIELYAAFHYYEA